MSRTPLRLVLGSFALLGLAACGGDGGGPTSPDTIAIRLVNGASRPIFFAYFSRCEDPSWGQDRLRDATVSPGASFRWSDLPPGCYDFQAELDDGRVAETYDVRIGAGRTYEWRPTDGSFVVRGGASVRGTAGTRAKQARTTPATPAF